MAVYHNGKAACNWSTCIIPRKKRSTASVARTSSVLFVVDVVWVWVWVCVWICCMHVSLVAQLIWNLRPGSSRPVAWMNEVVYLQQIIELYFFSSFPSSLSSLDTHESICRKKTTGIVLWNQHVTQQGAAGRSRMWLGVYLSHHSRLSRILRFGPKISSPNRHTCVFLLDQFFSETIFLLEQ